MTSLPPVQLPAEHAAAPTGAAESKAHPPQDHPAAPLPSVRGHPARIHHVHHLLPAVQSMLTLTAIALFFITFTLQPFRIPSSSMEPTLLVGDFLLVDKLAGSDTGTALLPSPALHRGEVIVFHDPADATLHLVKRIVGLPGDRVRLRGGHVLLNGQPLTEPYAVLRESPPDLYRDDFPNASSPDPDVDSAWWIRLHTLVDRGEVVVPPNNFFVLGDNRNDSLDSRYWGFVPRTSIVGRPFLIYLSLRTKERDPDADTAEDPPEPPGASTSRSFLSRLAHFARWNRTLTVIR